MRDNVNRAMRQSAVILFTTGILFLGACGLPRDQRVRRDFLNDNPSAEIAKIEPMEGNADSVYYRIHFRGTHNSPVQTVIWLYARRGKDWEVIDKNIPPEGP